MIGSLRGQIVDRNEEGIVLDVNGVGYELQCSLNTLADLLNSEVSASSADVRLWVQTYLREDALTLFGFSSPLEKKMFLSLVKVNGVGPKMAIKILSGATLEQLAGMIEAGDVKGLSNLPKVGKKTAEQLILSLKGKLVIETEGKTPKAKAVASSPHAKFTGVRSDVLSALVNLGFRLQDAEQVVAGLAEDVDLQKGIRDGLKALSGGF